MRKRLQRLEADREKLLEGRLWSMTNGEFAALAIQAGVDPKKCEWLLRHPDMRGNDFSSMSDAELLAELATMGLER